MKPAVTENISAGTFSSFLWVFNATLVNLRIELVFELSWTIFQCRLEFLLKSKAQRLFIIELKVLRVSFTI